MSRRKYQESAVHGRLERQFFSSGREQLTRSHEQNKDRELTTRLGKMEIAVNYDKGGFSEMCGQETKGEGLSQNEK